MVTREGPGALAPVAARVADTRDRAAAGAVRIDLAGARRLLARIDRIRAKAARLAEDGVQLDRPLRLGDSWVSHLLAERLRGVAVEDGGLTPALRTFGRAIDDLETTVRLAVDRYRKVDDESLAALNGAIGDLDARRERT